MNVHERKRDSNFELLRIIAMILIVFSHENQHGIWFPQNHDFGFNYLFCKSIFSYFGAIGNWLFIFVSGYFITEQSFSYKKILRLWFQVFSISVIIGLVTWFSKITIAPCWDAKISEIYLSL